MPHLGLLPQLAPEKPFYRYHLDVEVPATEVAVLVDAMEGEPLSMKARVGWTTLKNQLVTDQRITVDMLGDEAWADFENDIRILSNYLSEPIVGREVYVEPGEDRPLMQGWLVIGYRGETARVPLSFSWSRRALAFVDHGVAKNELDPPWDELPPWVKDAIGPELRAVVPTSLQD